MKDEDIEIGETYMWLGKPVEVIGETYMWLGKPVEVRGRSTTRCEVVTEAGRHWHVWARDLKPMPLEHATLTVDGHTVPSVRMPATTVTTGVPITSVMLLPHREQAREFEGVSPLRNLPMPHREQAREFEGVSPLRNLPMRQMLEAVEEMALAGSAVPPEILDGDGSPPSGLQQSPPLQSNIVCPHCHQVWDTAPLSAYEDGAEALCERRCDGTGGDCGGRFTLRRRHGVWTTSPSREQLPPEPWTPAKLPDLLSHGEPREDAPSYGGWSEGDVMAYLNRFGDCGNNDGTFFCRRGYFIAWFKWHWGEWLATVSVDPQVRGHTSHGLRTLPEALRWAVERWRELVAESDPMPQFDAAPQQPEPTQQHVMTGDLGARTEFGAGWHDPEDK